LYTTKLQKTMRFVIPHYGDGDFCIQIVEYLI
jgi:hypothetical protein